MSTMFPISGPDTEGCFFTMTAAAPSSMHMFPRTITVWSLPQELAVVRAHLIAMQTWGANYKACALCGFKDSIVSTRRYADSTTGIWPNDYHNRANIPAEFNIAWVTSDPRPLSFDRIEAYLTHLMLHAQEHRQ